MMERAAPPKKRIRDPQRGARILEAARKLFSEKGFHAVSVDEIGAAAGATGAAIYRHFSGKEELLATLFDAAQDRYLIAVPDRQDDPLQELDELVARHLEITLENRDLATIWAHETKALTGPHLRRLRRRTRQYLDRWVDCLRRAFPGRDDADLLAAANAAIGTTVSLAIQPDHTVTDREAEIVRRMVCAGLRSLAEPPGAGDA